MEPISRVQAAQTVKRPNRGLSRGLTFLIFLCVFFGVGGLILNQTVLKESFTQEQLQKPATLTTVTNEINEMLLDAAQKNGLPQSVQVKMLTESNVQTDLKTTVTNIYAGKANPLDTDQVISQMAGHLTTAIPGSGLLKSLVTTAVAAVQAPVKTYLETEIQTPYLTPLASEMKTVKMVVSIMMWVAIIMGIVLILVQFAISQHFKIVFGSLGAAFAWAGLLLWLLTAIVKYSGLIAEVAQRAGNFSQIVTNYGLGVLAVASQFSLIGLVAGAVVWLLAKLMPQRG